VADGGGPERPPTNTGWDTSEADSGPNRPPLCFPAPLTLTAGRPAVWTVPYTFSFPVIFTNSFGLLRLFNPGPTCDGMAQSVVLTYGDLSRRLQPGYNYVGQTNARQPLHIKCCGQVA
jgi:hypothetical protein